MSLTDDLSMQEQACDYIWASNMDSHACNNLLRSLSVVSNPWSQTQTESWVSPVTFEVLLK